MGKLKGFIEFERTEEGLVPVKKRVKNYKEFTLKPSDEKLKEQGGRCMDCGVPFCHSGCPLGNLIPDFNDAVYNNEWEKALYILHSTNNFPEFTGRLCPAPCEAACVLGIINPPVSIEMIEKYIVERGFEEGWIKANPPLNRTGKKVAVVGSGPAGLSAAQQLNKAGHSVDVYERDSKIGGLLRYGIPDFKMEKTHIDRRLEQISAEGVQFQCGVELGVDVGINELIKDHDAVILACGAEKPRDMDIEGRRSKGIHFAMDFLPQQNRRVVNESFESLEDITADGRHVVVIGGGDTGSDCIGTSIRQGALSVTQLEIMPAPPDREDKLLTWPNWPLKMRTSSSQEEGADREFSVLTKSFGVENGRVSSLNCIRVNEKFEKIDNSEFSVRADLVLLAMGFVSPITDKIFGDIAVSLDERGNVLANDKSYKTSHEKLWVAGDMRRGQSLVVWAIREGRQVAKAVDVALMGYSNLSD